VKKFKISFSLDKLKILYRFENLKEVYQLIKAFWFDVFLSFKIQDHPGNKNTLLSFAPSFISSLGPS
jgi:hypothetical protein